MMRELEEQTMRIPRALTVSLLLLAVLALLPRPVSAAAPARVTGGGATTITHLILVDGSTIAAELPTHLGFSAIAHANGSVSGQFECLINGPGFTGHFMNLHGNVDSLTVTGHTAVFGGDSNFGRYSVTVTDGLRPTIKLRWTKPFGPGAVGTDEILIRGTVRIVE
jgi:hypothetical protein